MRCGAPGGGIRARVGGGDRGVQAVLVEAEGDGDVHAVGIAGLSFDGRGQGDVVGGAVDDREVQPAGQAVQGVPARRLGDGELLRHTVEGVPAVDDPVRPGRQCRPAERRAHLVGVEGDDERAAAELEGAEAGPDGGDRGVVVARGQAEVGAGDGCGHSPILPLGESAGETGCQGTSWRAA